MSGLRVPPTQSVIAGYAVEAVLGRGATAVVYRARRLGGGDPVALKLIDVESRRRDDAPAQVEREAQLAAAVAHQGILPVYEVGTHEGRLFVAMKLAPGDLAAVLRREGRLDSGRAVGLVSQLASALDAAHAHGLVHRDVKPSNVLLDDDEGEEHTYLADFGAARAAFADRDLRPGELVGTVGYASPEQIRGAPVDRRTDVYALGCLLYECLTGRVPYASRDALATLWGHLHGEPPMPSVLVPSLPRALDEVVQHALAKSLQARFASAGELADAAGAAVARRSGARAAAPGRRPSPSTGLTGRAAGFLGREQELSAADALLGETRLLTVTGPGGAGKTRFSIELASRAREAPRADYGSVFVCFLAPLRDSALVLPTIAQTLSVSEGQGTDVLEALAARISRERVLLLLDNVEHLAPAAAELEQLLAACPTLSLLVTSRGRLRLDGETVYDLPPLKVEEGVALFCERAACEPSESIAELCSRLEGLPLAIELAAAHTSSLSPEQLLPRLSRRLDLLRTTDREADPRQQTLRATVEWSYDLLAPEVQTVFERLSVFTDGCTLDAAEAICDADRRMLESLLDNSLLRRSGDRLWMLETIRELAAERLAASGESEERRRRHAEHFAGLVERLKPETTAPTHVEALERLGADHANVVAAVDWAIENDTELALDLFSKLRHFLWDRGREGWMLARRVLAATAEPTLARALALHSAAGFASTYGTVAETTSLLEQALAIYDDLGDRRAGGRALVSLGPLYRAAGRADGRETIERGLARARTVGDTYGVALAIATLGDVVLQDGDFVEAARLAERAAAQAHEHGFEVLGAQATFNHAVALVRLADPRAAAAAHSALRLCARTKMDLWIGNTLFVVAASIAADEPGRAAILLGAAEAELDGARLQPAEAAVYEHATTTLRESLGATAFEQSLARGRGLGRDAAIELGLST